MNTEILNIYTFPGYYLYKESWALKNWCFWAVVLEKTLESPLDCKEIQPVHPKKISPGCSLEGLMLKLKLQYFGHLMWRVDSLEKTLMLGKDDRGWDGWMASLIQWTWVWVNSGSWWWTGRPGMLQSTGSPRVRHDWETELNWIVTWPNTKETATEALSPTTRVKLFTSRIWAVTSTGEVTALTQEMVER